MQKIELSTEDIDIFYENKKLYEMSIDYTDKKQVKKEESI